MIRNNKFFGDFEDYKDYAMEGGNATYGGMFKPEPKPLVVTPDPVKVVSNKTPDVNLEINEDKGDIGFVVPVNDDPIASAIDSVKPKPTKAESTIRTSMPVPTANPISTNVVQPKPTTQPQGNIDPRYAEYLRSGEAGDDRGGAQEQQTPQFVQGDDANRNYELAGFSGYIDDLRQDFGGEFDIGNGIDYRADSLRDDGQPRWESFYFDAKTKDEARDIATDYFVNKLGSFEDANQLWKTFEIENTKDGFRLEWENDAPLTKALDVGKAVAATALTGGALGALGVTGAATQGAVSSGLVTAVRGGDLADVAKSAILGGVGGYAQDAAKAADVARDAVVTNAQTINSGVGGAGAIAQGSSQGLAENLVSAQDALSTANTINSGTQLAAAIDSGNVAGAVSNTLELAGLPSIESTLDEAIGDVDLGVDVSRPSIVKGATKATETLLNTQDFDKALKEGLIVGTVEELKNMDFGGDFDFDLDFDLELGEVAGSVSDVLEDIWDVTVKPTTNLLEDGYKQILEGTKDIRETGVDVIEGVAGAGAQAVGDVLKASGEGIKALGAEGAQILEDVYQAGLGTTRDVRNEGSDVIDSILRTSGKTLEDIGSEGAQILEDIYQSGLSATRDVRNEGADVIDNILKTSGKSLESIGVKSASVLEDIYQSGLSATRDVRNEGADAVDSILRASGQTLESIGVKSANVLEDIYQSGLSATRDVRNEGADAVDSILRASGQTLESIGSEGAQILEDIYQSGLSATRDVRNEGADAVDSILRASGQTLESIGSEGAQVLEDIYQSGLEASRGLRETGVNVIEDVLGAGSDVLGDIAEAGGDVIEGIAGAGSDALEYLWDGATDIAEYIGEGAMDIFDKLIEGLNDKGAQIDQKAANLIKEQRKSELSMIELTSPSVVQSQNLLRNTAFRNPLL